MKRVGILFAAVLTLLTMPALSLAAALEGVGKSSNEIIALAKKEGAVATGGALRDDEVKIVLGGFFDKYREVKVEYIRVQTPEEKLRIFNELLAGRSDFDLLDISTEMMEQFKKAGVLHGPLSWRNLFPNVPKDHFSPDGYFAGGGFSLHPLAYNPDSVPAQRIPKDWADCLDPYWRGKFVMDTSAKTIVGLYPSWGEAKLIAWAKAIRENKPIWKRGQSESLTLLAAGEFPMICGTFYQSAHTILRRDPGGKIALAWPKEVPVSLNENMAVMKGARRPNAGLLLASWLASSEGQKGYDKLGRGSPFIEGTEAWQLLYKVGAKPIFGGWEKAKWQPEITRKIIAAWGLPQPSGVR